MNEIALEKEICFTTLKTLTVLFSEKRGAEAVALYFFYYKQCKLQNTDTTWTTDNFIKKGLGRGFDKIRFARNVLKKYNLVEMIQLRGDNGKVLKAYIRLNYYRSQVEPHTGLSACGYQDTNAYINKYKCLNKEKEMLIAKNGVEEKQTEGIPSEEKTDEQIKQSFVDYVEKTRSAPTAVAILISKFIDLGRIPAKKETIESLNTWLEEKSRIAGIKNIVALKNGLAEFHRYWKMRGGGEKKDWKKTLINHMSSFIDKYKI